MVRWGAGITLAGFVVGGGFAAVALAGSPDSPPAGGTARGTSATSVNTQASNAELRTLLSVSAASLGASAASSTPVTKPGPLRRIRGIGGYYGSLTFRGGTLVFERGTIQSVNHGDVVVRAPDGTTMTWTLVSDTVVRDTAVRDHGKASISALSDGQLVFVGGRMVSGARDARLIVVRTPKPNPATTPSTGPTSSTGADAS
jgi:hypothetical protein